MTLEIRDYINRHQGEPALVCGCGPSILQFDPCFYACWPGVTFGCNGIDALFDPEYYFNVEKLQNYFLDRDAGNERVRFLFKEPIMSHLDTERTGRLSMYGSVGLVAFSAAFQMGCDPICLIGIDFTGHGHRLYFSDAQPREEERPAYMRPDRNELNIHAINRAISQARAAGTRVVNLSKNSRVVD